MTAIGRDIERVAKRIVKQLLDDSQEISFHDRLDAFKALANYYIGVSRSKKKDDDADNGVANTSMADIRKRIGSEMQ